MRYLITSHAMAAVLEVNERHRLVDAQILSRGYHYGVCPTENVGEYWIYRGGEHGDAQTEPELLRFDLSAAQPVLRERRALPGLRDVHQILPLAGGLAAADTGNNRLVLLHGSDAQTEYVFDGLREDWSHVNSLHRCGGHLLALLHNKRRIESQVAVFAIQGAALHERSRLSLWDVLCHNLFVDDDRLIYLASHANAVVAADLRADRQHSRRVLTEAAQSMPSRRGHVKGLSAAGDLITVGVSEFAERERRRSAQGCLVQLDRRSLDLRGIVPLSGLPEPIGNINEVRRVDVIDEACADSEWGGHWSGLRLARRQPLRLAWQRLQLQLMSPLVKWRRHRRQR